MPEHSKFSINILFTAKLQSIEYSATTPKFPASTGNFGASGQRLGVERWRYDALVSLADRGLYCAYVRGRKAQQGAYIRFPEQSPLHGNYHIKYL